MHEKECAPVLSELHSNVSSFQIINGHCSNIGHVLLNNLRTK